MTTIRCVLFDHRFVRGVCKRRRCSAESDTGWFWSQFDSLGSVG